MQFNFKDKYLEIKFTWKEIFFICLRKSFRMDKFTVYKFSNAIMRIIQEMTTKYGDIRTHGNVSMQDIKSPNKEPKDT